jgi:hypothetical protein
MAHFNLLFVAILKVHKLTVYISRTRRFEFVGDDDLCLYVYHRSPKCRFLFVFLNSLLSKNVINVSSIENHQLLFHPLSFADHVNLLQQTCCYFPQLFTTGLVRLKYRYTGTYMSTNFGFVHVLNHFLRPAF